MNSPRDAQRDTPIQCSVSRPFFVAFVFSVMKRNFHEIASKKAIEPKLLVKPIHTLSLACSNLVAHPMGLAVPRLVNLSGSYHSLKESLPTCMHVFIAKEQADVVLVTSGREKITRRNKCCYQNRPIIEWEACSRLLPSER